MDAPHRFRTASGRRPAPDTGAGVGATSPGITGIRVEGYKSLRTPHQVELRPLTVIAGVNSSGKSSAIQPLLLLKQTLDTPYDPGPLQLSGPNVDVTAIEQVLSRSDATQTGRATSFTIGVVVSGRETSWTFGRDNRDSVELQKMTGWFFAEQDKPISLRAGMSAAHLRRLLPDGFLDFVSGFREVRHDIALAVGRDRCFLYPGVRLTGPSSGTVARFSDLFPESELSGIIHLPALRGNPERTYRTVAVRERFPGDFSVYTAGVIAAWQNRERAAELAQLRSDLEELGLTWKVEANKLDDTRVELLVGRLPRARRGGARDLVNIADVGVGIPQTLPVIVALLAAGPGQLVYLEQPEIHLHPRAQAAFANLLQRAVRRGVRVVVETHSALLVRAVQTLIAKEELEPTEVVLHWFTRDPRTGDTEISTAELDRAGAFGDWPEDFDEVYLEAEARYLDAAAEVSDA